MRLEKIRLAGFKSFVDPTVIHVAGNLVGVVGPNGCGKSNVIDAVRWVMGESSARHLRGESMADVIFNGSSTRKPVSLASVELIFDNGEGRAPGEYAAFAQIAIRRQVTRDGQSTYYLNGTRCRRKDITDLFLGTGLGPRSYAIIEQGTISRLIEARPDELRAVVEEAAGISRYKERRHETGLRMRHTQENLDRLRDVIEEVERQLATLQRQARKAEKFVALRDEERQLRLALMGYRWQVQQSLIAAYQSQLQVQEEAFRQHASQYQQAQDEEARLRAGYPALQDEMQDAQSRYYELGARLGQIEQQLLQAGRDRQQLLQEQARLTQEQEQLEEERQEDSAALEAVLEERELLAATLETQGDIEAELQEKRLALEQAQSAWRRRWEQLTERLYGLQRQLELGQLQLRQLQDDERRLQQTEERVRREREALEAILTRIDPVARQAEIDTLRAARDASACELDRFNDEAERLQRRQQQLQPELEQRVEQLHALSSRRVSLEALQAHAFAAGDDCSERILGEDAEHLPRLASILEVMPGGERAAEAVLGEQLGAHCVASLEALSDVLGAEAGQGSFALCESSVEPAVVLAGTLAQKVRQSGQPLDWLQHVHCAESLEEAMLRRTQLAPHEQLVLPDGLRLGRHWIQRGHAVDGQAGALARAQELRELLPQEATLGGEVESLRAELAALALALEQAGQQREQARSRLDADRLELAQVETGWALENAEWQRAQRQKVQLDQEYAELLLQRDTLLETRAERQVELEDGEEALATARRESAHEESRRTEAEQQRLQLERQLEDLRQGLQQQGRRMEALEARAAMLRQQQQRHAQRGAQLAERLADLAQRLELHQAQPDETLEALREELLEQRAEAELLLQALRTQVSAADSAMRTVAEARMREEAALNQVREAMQKVKLDWQGAEVRIQGLEEQFSALGAELPLAADMMPEDFDEGACQYQVQTLAEEIARMGAVNLAAMEEHQALGQRHEELKGQENDLLEALSTLESAIVRMDQECRTRFAETFKKINTGFQRMIPRLFGGGQASLELQGDGPEPGVSVMARPPGKRNSSIHLLSGGEKALTAVALVFAIFELNPAPFCLLDEVDAPLDEANVGRFGALVKEMSESVQFLFISHNKATMEIAEHLTGVTMQEPGVSRIVAVDLEAAVQLTRD